MVATNADIAAGPRAVPHRELRAVGAASRLLNLRPFERLSTGIGLFSYPAKTYRYPCKVVGVFIESTRHVMTRGLYYVIF